MWSQRSRAIWIKWGDRNTKFFHAIASQRLKKNFTMGLMDLDGKWQEDLRSIEGIILDYFASIFKSNYSSNFEASLNVVNPKETLDMNGTLIAKFREEAIWKAFHQMHPTKAPGLDDMSSIFYQKYWDIVRSSVIDCVLNTLNFGMMPCGLNETYICLILKVISPQNITKYKPLSLCNNIYKIISKVLAN